MFLWLKRFFGLIKPSGAMPHVVDTRDLKYEDYFVAGSTEQKKIPDMRLWGYLPDQGRYESCVGFSMNRLLQILFYQMMKEESNTNNYLHFSEKFVWGLGRERAGWPTENHGMYLRDAFKICFKDGILTNNHLPYSYEPMKVPDEGHKALADNFKRLLIARKFKYYLTNKYDIKSLVSKGNPVMIGMWINSDFFTKRYIAETTKKGTYAHCMVVEGTKMNKDILHYKVANWYGKGYVYVPESYFLKNVYEAWVLEKK